MNNLELIVTAAFGLEAVVGRELADLGYQKTAGQAGRLRIKGTPLAIADTNLWLRSADRVLLMMGEFEAKDFGVLFDQTYALPWENWLPANAAFPVRGRSVRSQLSSVPACQKIVKKAIVEKLRHAHGTTSLPENGPLFPIEVALLSDQATLAIDTTGPGLHKRGYRSENLAAPLKETLAAGLIELTFWRPDRPFWDPFCGSGTLPIEAAMIARRIAPGLNRTFAAERWPALSESIWSEAREKAAAQRHDGEIAPIIGSDVSRKALAAARRHAKQAGVAADIVFKEMDFCDLTSEGEHGCLVANPPYGERLADAETVEALYREMPLVLRRLPTWSHYILTSHDEFESIAGRKANRRRKLYNGPLACTYFQFFGPKPNANTDGEAATSEVKDTAPAFGTLPEHADKQAADLKSRLQKRARHFRRWPKRGISCYRLYERDVPGVPLVIDRYEDFIHVGEYRNDQHDSSDQHAAWLDLMCSTICEALDVSTDRLFLKQRRRQLGTTQHQRVARKRQCHTVTEGGLKFLVNLSDYIDTGLFLDHRDTRAMVREEAKGKRFLNLFAYTGAFNVYAAAGGASHTTAVDRSQNYLQWARENMELNGFSGDQHHFIDEDSMTYLRGLSDDVCFDLAVVDPPTFSNRKGDDDFWDIQRDYAALLNLVLQHIRIGGVVYFSTNFRKFKFTPEDIKGATVREISKRTVPEDFSRRPPHRCWRLVREGP